MTDSKQPSPSFLGKFTVLNGAARELWLTFCLKLLNYAAFAVTNLTLKLWLSHEFGYSDKEAYQFVLAWAISITVVTLMVGSLTDAIGLRKTFFLGIFICIFARLVMIFGASPHVAIFLGLMPLAVGEALGTPVLVAAVRKYSTTPQRSFSFSISYTVLNMGSFMAAWLFDYVRQGVGEHGHLELPLLHTSLTSYRVLFAVSLGIQFLMIPLVYLIRPAVEVTDDGIKIKPATTRPAGEKLGGLILDSVRSSAVETVRLFQKLFKQEGFHKLIIFLLLVAFLKMVLMHMYYVYPTFGIRVLGDGAPVGKLWGINALAVIILTPLIGVLSQRQPAYRMVTIGGIVTAASVFIMALPVEWFQPLADSSIGQWFGHGYLNLKGAVHPYYVMITVFVVVFSIGESLYSPRVYEYASAIAPKGLEASYASLSYLPFLLAKLILLYFAGDILSRYCPEVGERHPSTMWLYVALAACVAPVGLIVLRNVIRVREAGREK
ncbi:MAG TPA: MFS transporter [Verrucomicrobiae bacterium]|nr:MFS transporter [Verrucomicrobiae bacterium]